MTNRTVNMVPDSAEFYTTEPQELQEFLEEREKNAVWLADEDNCRADNVRFRPIFAEPICIPNEVSRLRQSNVIKFDASEEAYADTMYAPDANYEGTSQLMFINGHIYPVGASAINGITERAGIKFDGWDKLRRANPQDLSDVLGKLMKATEGYLTVLVEDEKVRAVNSGRYAACPATSVLNSVNRWLNDSYPNASFVKAYANHDYVVWHLNFAAYTDEIFGQFPELKNAGFTPAVAVQLSHTGTSSVWYTPCLYNSGIYFPICEGIGIPHIAKGTFSERMKAMEESVEKNLKSVFPKMSEVVKRLDAMRTLKVQNAYNALLRGMKALQIPKKQGMEAAEIFEALYGENATAYDIYIAVVDAFTYVLRDFPNDYRKQFAVAKSLERAIMGVDWVRLGEIPGSFSW